MRSARLSLNPTALGILSGAIPSELATSRASTAPSLESRARPPRRLRSIFAWQCRDSAGPTNR
jgi:hypothetical protein